MQNGLPVRRNWHSLPLRRKFLAPPWLSRNG